jgi:hypothetical protein
MSTTRQHLSSAVVDKNPYTLSEAEEEEEDKEENHLM